MHLYKHNCIFDLDNCIDHDGFSCSKCQKGFIVNKNGECQRKENQSQKEYTDKIIEIKDHPNALILADYGKSLHK